MNLLFRILVAVYAFISTVLCGIIMISPFGDKLVMSMVLDYFDVTFLRSNRYDVMVFIVGLVFFIINVMILTSGIKGRRSNKYYCTENE